MKIYIYIKKRNILFTLLFRVLTLCQMALHGERALLLLKRGNSSLSWGEAISAWRERLRNGFGKKVIETLPFAWLSGDCYRNSAISGGEI